VCADEGEKAALLIWFQLQDPSDISPVERRAGGQDELSGNFAAMGGEGVHGGGEARVPADGAFAHAVELGEAPGGPQGVDGRRTVVIPTSSFVAGKVVSLTTFRAVGKATVLTSFHARPAAGELLGQVVLAAGIAGAVLAQVSPVTLVPAHPVEARLPVGQVQRGSFKRYPELRAQGETGMAANADFPYRTE